MYDDIGSNLWNEGLTRAWDNYQTQPRRAAWHIERAHGG